MDITEIAENSAQLSETSTEFFDAKAELLKTKALLSDAMAQLTLANTARHSAEEKLAALEEVMDDAIDNRVTPLREKLKQANEHCTELEWLLASTRQDCDISVDNLNVMLVNVNVENKKKDQTLLFLEESLRQRDIELEEMRKSLENTQKRLKDSQERVNESLIERCRDLQKCLSATEDKLAEANRLLEAFVPRSDLSNSEAQCQDLRQQLQSVKVTLDDTNWEDGITLTRKRMIEAHDKVDVLVVSEESFSQCDKELEETRASLESTQKQISALEESFSQCDKELEETRASLECTQKQLSASEESLSQRDRELDEMRASLESTQMQLKESLERMHVIEEQLSQQYQIQIQELEIRARLAEEANTEMAELIVSLEERLDMAKQTVSQLHSAQTDSQDSLSESKGKALVMIDENVSRAEQQCVVCMHDRRSSQQGEAVNNCSSNVSSGGLNETRFFELGLSLTKCEELLKKRDLELEEMRGSLESTQRQQKDVQEKVRILMITEELLRQRAKTLEDTKSVAEELLKQQDKELEEMRATLENTQRQLKETQEQSVDASLSVELIETKKKTRHLEGEEESSLGDIGFGVRVGGYSSGNWRVEVVS